MYLSRYKAPYISIKIARTELYWHSSPLSKVRGVENETELVIYMSIAFIYINITDTICKQVIFIQYTNNLINIGTGVIEAIDQVLIDNRSVFIYQRVDAI